MAIDFISKNQDQKERKSQNENIIMHRPEKEAPVQKIKPRMGKGRLILILIFVIIILAGGGIYYLLWQKSNQPANTNLAVVPTAPEILPELEPESAPAPEPEIIPEPTPEPETQPVVLPDTELAPLRGSVIRFADSNDLYLIEENGELRLIDLNTVRFDNGQRITEISKSLIYTIADKWKDIRRGQEVIGLVDWDPRVLSAEELKPFL